MKDVTQDIENFRSALACSCGCGLNRTDTAFAGALMLAQSSLGTPFKILDGYRCPSRNAALNRPPSSPSLLGLHVDLAFESPQALFITIKALMDAGFERFRLYPNHLHIDKDPNFPVPSFEWHTYPPGYKAWTP